jgi:hypothetical protein
MATATSKKQIKFSMVTANPPAPDVSSAYSDYVARYLYPTSYSLGLGRL